jgi:glucose-6-phosphate isomerase
MGEQLKIEQMATEMSLVRAKRPCYRLVLPESSPSTIGALFYFMELLVVFTAKLWKVNPFDQPGVEEGKNITYSLMGRKDYVSRRPGYERELEQFRTESHIFQIAR